MNKHLLKPLGLAGFALAFATGAAFAHAGEPGHAHGFFNGFLHPLSGLDHLLAMLGVGLWSALIVKGPRVAVAPAAFVAAMLAGALAGIGGMPLKSVEVGIALSVLAMGALILCRLKPPLLAVAAIIGSFGVLHGYAHGCEAAGTIALYMAGFTLSTSTLHLFGIAAGRVILGRGALASLAGATMALAGASLLVF